MWDGWFVRLFVCLPNGILFIGRLLSVVWLYWSSGFIGRLSDRPMDGPTDGPSYREKLETGERISKARYLQMVLASTSSNPSPSSTSSSSSSSSNPLVHMGLPFMTRCPKAELDILSTT